MDRKIFSLFVTVVLLIIIIGIVNGADNKPVQSVFIFTNYKNIEEVRNNKILTAEYVYELTPREMLQVCTNVAKSTHFQLNGYKLIKGMAADKLRNYKVSYSNFGKRHQISAFRCPMEPPVYIQHRGKMIMVYVKKPKNYGCSRDYTYKERSTSYKSPFHKFFLRVKRFFRIKSHKIVRNMNGLICLGNNIGIAPTVLVEGSEGTSNQPWISSRIKLGNDVIHEINAMIGSGQIQGGIRFQGNVQPGEHEENQLFDGGPIPSVISSGGDTQTTINSEHMFDENINQSSESNFPGNVLAQTQSNSNSNFESFVDHRLSNSFQSNVESKISTGKENEDFDSYSSTVMQTSQVPSRIKFQDDIRPISNSDNSEISFGSSNLKTFANTDDTSISRGGRIDFAKDEYNRGNQDTLRVSVQPKIMDTVAKIHPEESEFGSISSLPAVARL